jgi:hypothetical protein
VAAMTDSVATVLVPDLACPAQLSTAQPKSKTAAMVVVGSDLADMRACLQAGRLAGWQGRICHGPAFVHSQGTGSRFQGGGGGGRARSIITHYLLSGLHSRPFIDGGIGALQIYTRQVTRLLVQGTARRATRKLHSYASTKVGTLQVKTSR